MTLFSAIVDPKTRWLLSMNRLTEGCIEVCSFDVSELNKDAQCRSKTQEYAEGWGFDNRCMSVDAVLPPFHGRASSDDASPISC
jgi:hypothetical protein